MTPEEIRNSKLEGTELLREIAAQLAEQNAHLAEANRRAAEGVHVIGPVASDLHGIFYAISAIAKRKGVMPR